MKMIQEGMVGRNHRVHIILCKSQKQYKAMVSGDLAPCEVLIVEEYNKIHIGMDIVSSLLHYFIFLYSCAL